MYPKTLSPKAHAAPSTLVNNASPSSEAVARSAVASLSKSDRPTRHINQTELSRRWTISPRTLERWRWLGEGPQYLKIGGRVAYRIEDIEAFEQARLRQSASELSTASVDR